MCGRANCKFVIKDIRNHFITKQILRTLHKDSLQKEKPNPSKKTFFFKITIKERKIMKSRTKQVTSALSPTSAGSVNANYPSINSTYWLPTSNPTPYVLPGLCCSVVQKKNHLIWWFLFCLLTFNHFIWPKKNRKKIKQNQTIWLMAWKNFVIKTVCLSHPPKHFSLSVLECSMLSLVFLPHTN